ncbi:P-loop containing nucleoside triphosphate hydrolase protein [Punctularia strigosozonata HHB-11173 SS5]|uniref:P-loop containing nucleoside triphosphate hydrolase protein n=1 Tax=Punctularia strigosozonata (strain HHB-11173) TaxID=741275 RepID=UPI0004417053|nr:P-loop containing nucleoside triphosphate hydrolase protein [Punctularia strigosozonata HHB-11173 SS5]EIN08827.1 P-loop containing nucleoside triphosphate hydrolase protein [Punctularia strigosozonata HHB-11173 SS5]
MDPVCNELAEHLVRQVQTIPTDRRWLVGVAGVPASGKSTIARRIVDRANALLAASASGVQTEAVMVGLDGWHLTRAQLDAFPDPKLAHDRRGAHWTFDGTGYLAFVRSLRAPIAPAAAPILAPSFDHALKDPSPDSVVILPRHRIVVIEGLYTFMDVEPWAEAGRLLDERWWVAVGAEAARERLVKRHVVSGVAKDLEEAHWRARENDEPNGRFVFDHLLPPTRTITSVDDPELVHV